MKIFQVYFMLTTQLMNVIVKSLIAQSSSRVGRRSRPGSLDGRRGEMDDDLDIVDAELSVVIGRRRPTDNRRPGDRDMALASLEILVAGERTQQPTTTTEKTNHGRFLYLYSLGFKERNKTKTASIQVYV